MLFLDDIRNPYNVYGYTNQIIYCRPWDVVRDYESFVTYIKNNGIPNTISFDHDLGDSHYSYQNTTIPYDEFNEKTGYHCAQWLINYCIDNNLDIPQRVLIHSMNGVGSKNIQSLFESYKKIYVSNNIEIKNLLF